MRDILVKIGLDDKLTAKLKTTVDAANKQIDSLRNKFSSPLPAPKQSAPDTSGIGLGDIIKGNLIANALSTVASGIMDAGNKLIGAFGSAINEADTRNNANLGSAGAIGSLLDLDFKEAKKLQEGVSQQMFELANKLPGASADYLNAFNGIADTLTISGNLTKEGLDETGTEIVKATALLGQNSGLGSMAVSTAIGKLLGETASESLFRIDAFEKTPALKAGLEKQLKASGKTMDDFFKMNVDARTKFFSKVSGKLFSPEMLAEMAASPKAMFDAMMSQMFDPQFGLFGFLRKIKLGGVDTNVLQQIGKLFTAMQDLGSAAGKVLASMGFVSFDPMVKLAQTLQSITSAVKTATAFFTANDGYKEIGAIIAGIDYGGIIRVGIDALWSLANRAREGIDRINWEEVSYQAVGFISSAIQHLIKGIAYAITNYTDDALAMVGTMLKAIIGSVIGLLKGLDNAVGEIFNTIIESAKNMAASLWGAATKQQNPTGQRVKFNAHGNLLEAIGRETNLMPANAKPVIANSSEIIIPQSRAAEFRNQINVTINARLDQIVNEVSNAVRQSMLASPLSMTS